MKNLLVKLLCATAFLYPGAASATVWYFNITGTATATFSIDSSVLKPSWTNNTGLTYNASVAGVYNGVTATRSVQFFNDTGYGGFNIGFVGHGWGSTVYTGAAADPVFTLGTYTFQQFGDDGSYTMTISDVAPSAAVPEPATWGMMIVGFGLIGGAARYRRRRTTVTYA